MNKLRRIADVLAQPPDRISHITIESYEKIRQEILKIINEPAPDKEVEQKKCICENPYDMDECILIDGNCPIHGSGKRGKI